jgi:hypothetical protein
MIDFEEADCYCDGAFVYNPSVTRSRLPMPP